MYSWRDGSQQQGLNTTHTTTGGASARHTSASSEARSVTAATLLRTEKHHRPSPPVDGKRVQEGPTTAWAILRQDCMVCPLHQVSNGPVHHHMVYSQAWTQPAWSAHHAFL